MLSLKRVMLLFVCICTFLATIPIQQICAAQNQATPNQPIFGALSVKNGQLTSGNGSPVQLRGFSSHGLQKDWFPGYINDSSVAYMKKNWSLTLVRAAMYTNEGGYYKDPSIENEVDKIVAAAERNGIYAIIDWHILSDNDPMTNVDKAMAFFKSQAQKHGKSPNVLFEICNEPNGVTWEGSIKPYAEKVIPVIRQYSNNIILVGTPSWSSELDKPASNPIKAENIMYSLHFYAGTDAHNNYKDLLKRTQESNPRLPVFVTEFGTCNYTGDSNFNEANTADWINLLSKYNISWCNWSLGSKKETASALMPNAPKIGFTSNDLTPSGKCIVKLMSSRKERQFIADTSTTGQAQQDLGRDTNQNRNIFPKTPSKSQNSWQNLRGVNQGDENLGSENTGSENSLLGGICRVGRTDDVQSDSQTNDNAIRSNNTLRNNTATRNNTSNNNVNNVNNRRIGSSIFDGLNQPN